MGGLINEEAYKRSKKNVSERRRDKTYLRNELKKPKDSIIAPVPNALAQVLCPFLKDGILTSMTGEITEEARKAPEGKWVIRGSGIELPCAYYIYESKKHKAQVRNGIRKVQSSL